MMQRRNQRSLVGNCGGRRQRRLLCSRVAVALGLVQLLALRSRSFVTLPGLLSREGSWSSGATSDATHNDCLTWRSSRIFQHRTLCRAGEAPQTATVSQTGDAPMVSPFESEKKDGSKEQASTDSAATPPDSSNGNKEEKPKLALTLENVEIVLDELRPYLRSDGGDCRIVEIDGPVVRLELQGACSSCSASSVTLKMGIEKTLKERIPEVLEVVAVMPEQEPFDKEGIEEVLNGIRPFLKVSGGTIDIHEVVDAAEGQPPQLTLRMTGPPLKSMAVKTEVVNRMKRKYPMLQEVNIVPESEAETKSL